MSPQSQQTVDSVFRSSKRRRAITQVASLGQKEDDASARVEGFGAHGRTHLSEKKPDPSLELKAVDKASKGLVSDPSTIPIGRSFEFHRLRSELEALASEGSSRHLFIAGLPGSGKTFVVERALENFCGRIQAVHINMAGIRQVSTLFQTLEESLGGNQTGRCAQGQTIQKRMPTRLERPSANNTQTIDVLLRKRLQRSRRPLCLVLDEVDLWLAHRGRRSLAYALFTIPLRFPKRCCVIGIANAVDFTERALPALRSMRSVPIVLIFAPYTSQDLVEIARQRLGVEGLASDAAHGCVHGSALELAARKVAAAHQGDVRAMLSACRKVFTSDHKSDAKSPEPAALHEIVTRLGNKTNSTPTLETIGSLPTQQQIVLWVLAKCAYPACVKLREVFVLARQLFAKLRLETLDLSTLHEICSTSLRHHGIVEYSAAPARGARQSLSLQNARVRLQIAPADVHDALRDIPSLHALLGCATISTHC
ncbi:hypothetical protein CCYA_CCYA14G3814 [Cyanidiococcus yangmingshanensis]|nr:hypothetical protein CCYA_CCYA14G3814 [Cyanidiococcus yangmingshanensis]